MSVDLTHFAPQLIKWQRQYGRHDLPWQKSLEPYQHSNPNKHNYSYQYHYTNGYTY